MTEPTPDVTFEAALTTEETAHKAYNDSFEAHQKDAANEETKKVFETNRAAYLDSRTKRSEAFTALKAHQTKLSESQKPPEKYDLKVPDGSYTTKEFLETFTKTAKEEGLTNVEAQDFIDMRNEIAADIAKTQQVQHKQTVEGWVGDGEKDKEIGGDTFKKNVELSKRMVDTFMGDRAEFKKFLNDYGFGNHPEWIRFLTRIRTKLNLSEDKFVVAGPATGEKKSVEQTLYNHPTSQPQQSQ